MVPLKQATFFVLVATPVPQVQREEDQSATGLILRTHSAGPVSQILLKGESWLRAETLDDSTPQ
jgi:hypothetical protein